MIRSVKCGGRMVEYTLVSARNRTTLLLQALPQGKIKLYAPSGYSLREADKLIKSKIDEIDRCHAAMEKAAGAVPGTILYKGRRLRLDIMPARKDALIEESDRIVAYLKNTTGEKANASIRSLLARQALVEISAYLEKWAPTVKKQYGRVTIREQRTRWGSCSSKSNLNFNWKLIMAPPEAMEYVVIHELCHLIHLNHSDKFWTEVRRRMPDYEIWKKWLGTNGRELNFP